MADARSGRATADENEAGPVPVNLPTQDAAGTWLCLSCDQPAIVQEAVQCDGDCPLALAVEADHTHPQMWCAAHAPEPTP
jgi:hypothetical protein